MTAIKKSAMVLIEKLDFVGCIELYEKLPSGHPMVDWVFDRMESIDEERFERFLDGE